MLITAKFASNCSCCRQPIQVGSKIEWTKGSPARHTACAAGPAVASTTPRATSARPWRPCGYPGCSRAHCDECDGAGLVLESSSGRSYRPRY